MTTLTITAKGQITLNKALLREMGVGPGDKVEVSPAGQREITIRPAAAPRTGRMEDAFGMLARPGQKPLAPEEIDDAIGQAVAEDHERIQREWKAARQ